MRKSVLLARVSPLAFFRWTEGFGPGLNGEQSVWSLA